jgi:DNA-binding LacI/PurR family transcriptional regulator
MPADPTNPAEKAPRRPQYRSICADMRARICRGEWERGRAIPPLRVLQELYPASRMTVLRAMHLLEELGYVRVMHGRGTFVRRRLPGRRVGILCGDDIFSVPPPPFAAAVCQGLRNIFERGGYEPRLYVVEGYDSPDECYPNTALERDVRRSLLTGLALIATEPLPGVLIDAGERGLPLVDLGGNVDHVAHLDLDLADFLATAVRWLVQHGRSRIALLHSHDDMPGQFRAHCRAFGIPHRPEWVLCGSAKCGSPVGDAISEIHVEAQGFVRTRQLWQAAADKPDALIVADDIMAKGAAQAMLALGLDIPRELLLLAAGNTAVPLFYPVPLARYEFDTQEIVRQAAHLLVEQIDGRTPPRPTPVRGRIRETGLFTL